jgi:hypothetical protein
VGLMGCVEPAGEIRGLRLVDARVTTGVHNFYVGLLAGRNLGTVSDCSVQGTLLTEGNCELVGGMAGFNEGSLTRCGVDCRIGASGGWMGGLVGVNLGQISQCAVRGSSELSGWLAVGGVAGLNSCGRIYDTYSMLSIAAPTSARGGTGGLVGRVDSAGPHTLSSGSGNRTITVQWQGSGENLIRNCYAAGRISGDTQTQSVFQRMGGLISWVSGKCTVTGSVWDVESTGIRFSDAGTGLKTQQMMDSATLASYGFDLVDTWTLCEGEDYPRLRWEQVQCPE